MNWIIWLIIFCEIAFWVVIALGLVTRYIFRRNTLGLFFLALTPVIDLLLLVATGFDLLNGGTAKIPHAIAAVYIATSLVFGKNMIRWADSKFQYYIMKEGNKPIKLTGFTHSISYAKMWLKHLLAYVIGTGLLRLIIFLINDTNRTEALDSVINIWNYVIIIDLIICITYFIWPRKEKTE